MEAVEDVLSYTREELLVTRAAREVADGDVVFVGIGLPNRAANLARRRQAPQAQLIYESGVYGAAPSRWPQSIGDPSLVDNAIAVHSMADLFLLYLQRGLIDVGFLGAAQVDRYGNLNSTVIGDYRRPTVRLPGSGGACEIALLTRKLIITIPQSIRNFPARLDFVTSPGHRLPDGGDASLEPRAITVISDMAVFGFDAETQEMELRSLHPGATLAELRASMGWAPRIARDLTTTPPPTAEELDVLRHYSTQD